MKKFFLAVLMISFAFSAQAVDGMINVSSSSNVSDTANRLEAILKDKGMTVMNRISHSAAAKNAGVELRDTELLIFGNPRVGSPLMACQQSVAIDLPQKALVWEDDKGAVWISYNDPAYLQKRHRIEGCDALLGKISKALAGMVKAAASN